MIKVNNDIYKDSNGNKSSKRIYGAMLIIIAIILSIVLFSFSLYTKVGDPATATNVINGMYMLGGGLLGIGVFEKKK